MSNEKITSEITPQESVQRIETRFGELEFQSGYPTAKTVEKLYDELDFQRAVQVYLWSNIMASFGAIRDDLRSHGAGSFDFLLFEQSAVPSQIVLTANNDTPYISGSMDLNEGPIVMEVPAGLVGPIDNIWQQPIVDVGGPFGPDKMQGGKFLILPPGYEGEVPEGYFVGQSDTRTVVWYLRAIPKTRGDFKALADHMRTLRIYPLSEADAPRKTKIIEIGTAPMDSLHKEGFDYWMNMARYIDDEPARPQDMAFLGMAATLGIEKGKPFAPDERMKRILTEAAMVGRAMVKAIAWKPRFPAELLFAYQDRHWKWIFVVEDPTFHTENNLIIDQRTRFGFEAIGTAKAMTTRIVGAGSAYVGVYEDADGNWLEGQYSYKLHLPAGVPANLFWSATVYDNETRSQLDNGTGRPPVRGSVHGTVPNEDGSFDLFFSPEPPANVDENNWVKTVPGKGFFVYLRLYGPKQPFFDKTWKLDDVEKVK